VINFGVVVWRLKVFWCGWPALTGLAEEARAGPTTVFFRKRGFLERRRGISASNSSIISPIAEVDWSNSEHRLRICSDILDKVKRNVLETEDLSLFYRNDYKELLDAVRVKVFNLSSLKIYIY
jgi:hypothetical protein